MVRAPDSWLKGRGYESLQEQRKNFLLQGQLKFLCWLLFRYPFLPRVTAAARKRPPGHSAKSAGSRLQLTRMHLTYVALHEVTWCMVVWCVRHDSGGDDDMTVAAMVTVAVTTTWQWRCWWHNVSGGNDDMTVAMTWRQWRWRWHDKGGDEDSNDDVASDAAVKSWYWIER